MTDFGEPTAAIVGAGLMGRWHAHALRRIGGRVTLVVDADESRARRLARAHGAGHAAELDPERVARAAPAAHVCTPLETHEAIAATLVEAGVHALVEKPLCAGAAATEALLGRADAAGIALCPVHQLPFQRGFRRVLRLLPGLGPVRHLDFTACTAGADGRDEATRDELVADVLPHPLSLFASLLDLPLAALDWQVARRPGELRAEAAAGDATIGLLVSTHGRPTVNALRVICERGTARVDLFHGYAVVQSGRVGRSRKIVQPFTVGTRTLAAATANLAVRTARREPAYPGLRELVRAFHLAVSGHAPPPIPAAVTLDVARARDRVLGKS